MGINPYRKTMLIGLMMLAVLFTGCHSPNALDWPEQPLDDWVDILEVGQGKRVTILMWGGNEAVNRYMDDYVAKQLFDRYEIRLTRIPMNPPEYLLKLTGEKESGMMEGTADLLWINAENFGIARESDLLYGPFTSGLPNLNAYYDLDSYDLNYDAGIPIEGYEAVWGKAQLVLSYDEAIDPIPPQNYHELLEWVKENPGKFTYPRLPDDFVGTAFVRNAYYEILGVDAIEPNLTQDAFNNLSEPVIAYFKTLAPFLWLEGKNYPASNAQLDEMFKMGEVSFTMGFEIGKTIGLIDKGVYPASVSTYIFETGSIGNAHYLAIPFNSKEKAAAMLVIDFLQSPEAQIEKMKPGVWGDLPSFDFGLLDTSNREVFEQVELMYGNLSMKTLMDKRLPEMEANYIDWIKELWVENFR